MSDDYKSDDHMALEQAFMAETKVLQGRPADLHLCMAVARYFELRAEQAAQRESDRVARQLGHRITEYANRKAIRRSLRENRGAR